MAQLIKAINKIYLVRSIDLTSGFSGDTNGTANQTLPHEEFEIFGATFEQAKVMKVMVCAYDTNTFLPVTAINPTCTIQLLHKKRVADVVDVIAGDTPVTSTKMFEYKNVEYITQSMAIAVTSVSAAITAQPANIKLGVFIELIRRF